MKNFLNKLREIAIAGFFALFPLCVLLIIVTKAWSWLTAIGSKIAGMFGLKSFLGVGGTTIVSGILVVAVWIICGLLVRVSFFNAMSRSVERTMSKYIPGYDTYKEMAEEKLQHKVRILPYASALLRLNDYWQPAYLIEEDQNGNCVIFLPEIPETNRGRLVIARKTEVRLLPFVTANELDASLKKMGKGLLDQQRHLTTSA